MRVGQWLFVTVMPGILGLLLVAALAFSEREMYHAASVLTAVAIVAAVISAGIAWWSTRHIELRVERLTDAARAALDARDEGTRRERAAEARAEGSIELLREAVESIGARLKEAQLPLHILLSSPFGELNENQEEMLAAARSATDEVDMHLRRLTKLVELEQGTVVIVPQAMSLADLLRPALSIAEARAAGARVHVRARTSTTAPRAIVDPVHAQEALSALLTEAVQETEPEGEVMVDAGEDELDRIRIVVTHGVAPATRSLEHQLAMRLIEAQHGQIREAPGQTIVELPHEEGLVRAAPAE